MPGALISWTPRKIETVRAMWTAGSSAGEIAAVLGVSRDSVLGRVYRMGLVRNPTKPRVVAAPKPPRVANPKPVRQPLPPVDRLWALDEEKRRKAFARRASQGAREALEAAGR